MRETKSGISSITKVLNQDQISRFKKNHCDYCQHYGGEIIPFCSAEVEDRYMDNIGINKIIIDCIENEFFKVRNDIIRAE